MRECPLIVSPFHPFSQNRFLADDRRGLNHVDKASSGSALRHDKRSILFYVLLEDSLDLVQAFVQGSLDERLQTLFRTPSCQNFQLSPVELLYQVVNLFPDIFNDALDFSPGALRKILIRNAYRETRMHEISYREPRHIVQKLLRYFSSVFLFYLIKDFAFPGSHGCVVNRPFQKLPALDDDIVTRVRFVLDAEIFWQEEAENFLPCHRLFVRNLNIPVDRAYELRELLPRELLLASGEKIEGRYRIPDCPYYRSGKARAPY